MGGISVWQLLIIAIIVLLIFGTKKIRNLGGDLGEAIAQFRKSISTDETNELVDTQDNIEPAVTEDANKQSNG
ncbi:MAG: twin-arginine translocase TatA/TatE family subunit [Endozoicomonadaceae bacterium]|nr:twin-arginine translocase TatA/TatE family subunit [Endozoicomonadaceae bacterium]